MIAGIQQPLLSSRVYETTPVDCEPGAGSFLNAVIEIGYGGAAGDLLEALRETEQQLGRPPRHAKNTSRTIDLDLLYFGDTAIDTPELQLPHPRLHERAFVLQPLAEIRPDLILPNQHRPVADLLRELGDTSALVRSEVEW